MTIEKYGYNIEMICDLCDTGMGDVYSADDFDVLIKDAKEQGWKMRRSGNSWEHICPDCK